MRNVDAVLEAVTFCSEGKKGAHAVEISEHVGMDRSNVSRLLNQLFREGHIEKIDGRPVLFKPKGTVIEQKLDVDKDNQPQSMKGDGKSFTLDNLVGSDYSMAIPIQQAKAAMLYPPRGLHTMLLGETGVGKSMFAELMHEFSRRQGIIASEAPFIKFNCADYAENPQLLVAQIFGVKKGAFTGADKDREGLLKKAHGGMLFLDEVHRLSPQGQEMLFTYMDEGRFRRLGDSEGFEEASVQIIVATTEDTGSFLLRTFTRRIPMTITLPSLKDRGLTERFYLIEAFIKEESKRVGKSIYINKNAISSLMIYDCPNNIGQLKSDIQLSCARSFLNYKSQNETYLMITQGDLPHHVKKGLMQLKDYRAEIDKVLESKEDIFRFNHQDEVLMPRYAPQEQEVFYDAIERKLEALKSQGLSEEEINQILNVDIESHFREYLGDLPKRYRKEEISKIVNIEIVEAVEVILTMAEEALHRSYDEKIYFGLALHLNGSIERIRSGGKIYHPKLNLIRVTFENEFIVAMKVAKWLDKNFDIETPMDEIGYLTMFLASNPYELGVENNALVGVVVIMHGNTTASSMVSVANTLIGTDHAVALDMPLSMTAEAMYDLALQEIQRVNRGKGVILLVDMGSLTNFGDMIYEETGIIVKTIDMVSTPIVLEVVRRAILGRDLFEIFKAIKTARKQESDMTIIRKRKKRKKAIITACFTGEGASERLKTLILEKLEHLEDIEIFTMNILNRKEFQEKIDNINDEFDILAIAGTVEIDIQDIPFISFMDIISGEGIHRLREIIDKELNFRRIGKSLSDHVEGMDSEKLVDTVRLVIDDLEESLHYRVRDDVKLGMILHISFMVDKIRRGGKETDFKNLEVFKSKYSREMVLTQRALEKLELDYGIYIGENEQAYVCYMLIENGRSV
jgi:transcriptional regulatory protein LevR/transcriptional regulator with AAA-type ATPase domain